MPSDLILPAFALVLVANAILIALAIRTFIADRAQERGALAPSRQRQTANAPSAVPVGSPPQPSPAAPADSDATPPPGPAASEPAASELAGVISPAGPKSRRKRPSTVSSSAAAVIGDKPTARRRRFSMPAHEEDREKFDRSIASFLSGGRIGRDHD